MDWLAGDGRGYSRGDLRYSPAIPAPNTPLPAASIPRRQTRSLPLSQTLQAATPPPPPLAVQTHSTTLVTTPEPDSAEFIVPYDVHFVDVTDLGLDSGGDSSDVGTNIPEFDTTSEDDGDETSCVSDASAIGPYQSVKGGTALGTSGPPDFGSTFCSKCGTKLSVVLGKLHCCAQTNPPFGAEETGTDHSLLPVSASASAAVSNSTVSSSSFSSSSSPSVQAAAASFLDLPLSDLNTGQDTGHGDTESWGSVLRGPQDPHNPPRGPEWLAGDEPHGPRDPHDSQGQPEPRGPRGQRGQRGQRRGQRGRTTTQPQ